MKKGKAGDELSLQKEITFTDLLCMGRVRVCLLAVTTLAQFYYKTNLQLHRKICLCKIISQRKYMEQLRDLKKTSSTHLEKTIIKTGSSLR